MTDDLLHKPPTPKRLVLSLLSAPDLREVSVRECTRWGDLFAIDAPAMRVAIGRMVKTGLLRSARRGVYAVGPRGESLSRAARRWRTAEEGLCAWSGEWLLVHTSHLGRSDRVALRGRERAMHLEGMQPLKTGLWCRPANYREPLSATRARMLSLGLDANALVLRADEVLGADEDRLEALWPREALEARYREFTAAMELSAARIVDLDLEAAARETFLLGEAVIRLINADPLLPAEFIDVRARGELVRGMLAYDELGRRVWASFRRSADR